MRPGSSNPEQQKTTPAQIRAGAESLCLEVRWLLGCLEEILDGVGGNLSTHQQRDVSAMRVSTRLLLSMAEDVVELAAEGSASGAHGRWRACQLATLCRDAWLQYQGSASSAQDHFGVTVQLEIRPVPPIQADPAGLLRVMGNLIGNALQFSEKGTICLSLDQPDPAYVCFSVSDSGPGMDKKRLTTTVRAKTNRTVKSASDGGYGLGLAICRRQVALHGGELTIESRPSLGTCVKVRLPVAYQRRDKRPLSDHEVFERLRGLGHDLRSPLSLILGFAQIWSASLAGPVTPQQQELFAQVNRRGRALLERIDALLRSAEEAAKWCCDRNH